ncbi:MAG: hypothetical protein V4648_04915 [Bacteroidota bacterium]
MKNLVAVALFFISFSGFAQDKATIMGKWSYKDAFGKETMDAEDLKMVTTMFKDLSLEFKESEVLLTMMGKTEPAQWSFSEKDPNIITVVSKTGKNSQMVITKLDEKELIISIGRAGPFIMTKS